MSEGKPMSMQERTDRAAGSPPPLSRAVQIVLWLMVASAAVRFGMDVILLAKKSEMRDFAASYTAAAVAWTGRPFYDPQPGREWFADNQNPDLLDAARRLGTLHRHEEYDHVHIFSYPPAMMFFMLPFAAAPFSIAKVGWMAFSLLAIGAGFWLIGRTIRSGPLAALLMVFLAVMFQPLRNTLDLGQVNALMFLLLAVFFWLYRGRKDAASGFVLGLATAIRMHPALLIAYLFWRREYRTAIAAVAAAGVLSVLAFLAFGVDANRIYFEQVAPKFARALVSVENHSLTGFLEIAGSALGLADPGRQVGSPWTARIAVVLVLAVTALLMPREAPVRGSRAADLEFALMLVVTPLAAPIATINHLLLILPSYWILFDHILGKEGRGNLAVPWLAGLSVILIGVVNDFYVHPALSRGLLMFAAEIKFYGLFLLWLALILELREARRGKDFQAAPVSVRQAV